MNVLNQFGIGYFLEKMAWGQAIYMHIYATYIRPLPGLTQVAITRHRMLDNFFLHTTSDHFSST